MNENIQKQTELKILLFAKRIIINGDRQYICNALSGIETWDHAKELFENSYTDLTESEIQEIVYYTLQKLVDEVQEFIEGSYAVAEWLGVIEHDNFRRADYYQTVEYKYRIAILDTLISRRMK